MEKHKIPNSQSALMAFWFSLKLKYLSYSFPWNYLGKQICIIKTLKRSYLFYKLCFSEDFISYSKIPNFDFLRHIFPNSNGVGGIAKM